MTDDASRVVGSGHVDGVRRVPRPGRLPPVRRRPRHSRRTTRNRRRCWSSPRERACSPLQCSTGCRRRTSRPPTSTSPWSTSVGTGCPAATWQQAGCDAAALRKRCELSTSSRASSSVMFPSADHAAAMIRPGCSRRTRSSGGRADQERRRRPLAVRRRRDGADRRARHGGGGAAFPADDAHAGGDYVLTGPESLSQAEQVGVIGDAIGRRIRFEELRRTSSAARPRGWPPRSSTCCSPLAATIGATGVRDLDGRGRDRHTGTQLRAMGRRLRVGVHRLTAPCLGGCPRR